MESLRFPLTGEWDVHNPPGHHPNAFDFIAKRKGRPFPRSIVAWFLGGVRADSWFGYGQAVHSPCDGVVEYALDGVPDRPTTSLPRDLLSILRLRKAEFSKGDLGPFAGNHVIIRRGRSFVLIAHLRCGTVRPKTGGKVSTGDLIGEIGNSGASLAPHLHLQVMDGPNFFTARVLPFAITGAEVYSNGEWTSPGEVIPAKGVKLRGAG